ncbi:asparagine synthase (glutamine-hydrolyzing) [uncultured Pontibacter sp.]|uniref:asparagine synthase (glutamine-hydrolyzing) n=1 Tax=uncultured Pontibacter sp. TaxID=453356 RepID=UPI002628BF6A|nr:asparagine synthase (glutamine-hydrolyzing) [uncultured Pontibacter sp.]
MCGILGHVNLSGSDQEGPFLGMIGHRGPDGRGEWLNSKGNVYLGHVRLAILEPTAAGHQPMHDAKGRYTITFNGEIYNHLELRALMPTVEWRGYSDTETLLELYARKGLEALPLLKGMFAFAIYDSVTEQLVLVRDRLGIKPLYYKHDNTAISFASEVRPLLDAKNCIPTPQSISEYIAFGRLPGSGELFESVYALPAATWMAIDGSGKISKGRWWPDEKRTFSAIKRREDYVLKTKKLVTKAVEEHLISDVGVGAFLSGGIDSSIVALVAGQTLGKNLRTFTVGFTQATHDERNIARKVARQAGSEHCELEVSEDTCLAWVMEAVAKLDLPSVDAINTYIVSKAVRESGLKVALSGLGGDELFGGYPSFKDVPILHKLGLLPFPIRKQMIKLMPQSLKDKLEGLKNFNTTELTVNRRRFMSVAKLNALGFSAEQPQTAPAPQYLDTMGMISWAEIQQYMIPMLLRDSDQMSMAVGLEIRVPFLDHSLVQEMMHCPQNFKKGKGIKPLLIDAFRAELPPEVYNRAKQGFSLPMDAWMRGPLADFTEDGVASAADYLSLSEPFQQYDSFVDGGTHWTRVWQWCVLGHWLASKKVPQKNARVISGS